jgi:hypothetical protein
MGRIAATALGLLAAGGRSSDDPLHGSRLLGPHAASDGHRMGHGWSRNAHDTPYNGQVAQDPPVPPLTGRTRAGGMNGETFRIEPAAQPLLRLQRRLEISRDGCGRLDDPPQMTTGRESIGSTPTASVQIDTAVVD